MDLPQCPRCHHDLAPGAFHVGTTGWGFLFFGFSYKHLWFERVEGGRRMVLRNGDRRAGWHCPACGCIIIPPDDRYRPT
jgi:hypothetical protein